MFSTCLNINIFLTYKLMLVIMSILSHREITWLYNTLLWKNQSSLPLSILTPLPVLVLTPWWFIIWCWSELIKKSPGFTTLHCANNLDLHHLYQYSHLDDSETAVDLESIGCTRLHCLNNLSLQFHIYILTFTRLS